ncbi:hypothetical protein FRC02_009403 [Tulasnella sp. 418]|nr:hypothetical protein FRC02_009403 [Tulasnella sp. 418]
MGKSAKLHKKKPKPYASSGRSLQQTPSVSTSHPSTTQGGIESRGRNKKSRKRDGASEGHILGDVDYVELMFGGRRKAKTEALKVQLSDEQVKKQSPS